MARDLTTSDLIQKVAPVGMSVHSPWMFGIIARFDGIAPDGTAFFKLGDNNNTGLTRGYMGYVRGADGNQLVLRAGNGQICQGSTGLVIGNFYRIVFSASIDGGVSYPRIDLNGVTDGSSAVDTPANIGATDSLAIGYGHSSFGIGRMNGAVARAWFLQGAQLPVADGDAIFFDFAAALATYGTDLKLLSYIEGAANPEPDLSAADNDLTVTGTTAVDDPIGIPGGGPEPALLDVGFDSVPVTGYDVLLREGRQLPVTFSSVPVSSFSLQLVPGSVTLPVEFDGVAVVGYDVQLNQGTPIGIGFSSIPVSSFPVGLVRGRVLGVDFHPVPVDVWPVQLTPGALKLGLEFTSVPVTGFPVELFPGVPAGGLDVRFDSIPVVGYDVQLVPAIQLGVSFTTVPLQTFPVSLSPGLRLLPISFSSTAVDSFPLLLRQGSQQVGVQFSSVPVTGWPVLLTRGGRLVLVQVRLKLEFEVGVQNTLEFTTGISEALELETSILRKLRF